MLLEATDVEQAQTKTAQLATNVTNQQPTTAVHTTYLQPVSV